jgi:hypothetical protein
MRSGARPATAVRPVLSKMPTRSSVPATPLRGQLRTSNQVTLPISRDLRVRHLTPWRPPLDSLTPHPGPPVKQRGSTPAWIEQEPQIRPISGTGYGPGCDRSATNMAVDHPGSSKPGARRSRLSFGRHRPLGATPGRQAASHVNPTGGAGHDAQRRPRAATAVRQGPLSHGAWLVPPDQRRTSRRWNTTRP